MKVRNVCLISVFLIIGSLIVVSCGGGTTTTSSVSQPPTTTTTPPPTKTTTAVSNVPQYGGEISVCLVGDPSGFDETIAQPGGATTIHLTNQELMIGDWTKGLAGSGEATWTTGVIRKISLSTGALAESWEIGDPGTMIFNIRKGVRFGLNTASEASRLVNGREITALDIAEILNKYITTPRSPLSMGDTRKAKIVAVDDYTLSVTLPVENFSDMDILGDYADSDMAPELYKKYGNLTDWRNSVGTGPYMLTDYLSGSSATLVKNPNFWEMDPIGAGKGKPLPYIDKVKMLIIVDPSTRLSALRTAKIDILNDVFWEDAKSLQGTNPDLKQQSYYADSGLAINMRIDKQDLPYKDVKVRQALMMATDFETIKDTWAGGEAQINTFPILKMPEYADAYCPIEEASAEVQELYKYNPEKAKQYLADAGYPEGFKATVVCSTVTTTVDYLSIIKQMWADVGIELTISQKESAVYQSIFWTRAYDDLFQGGPGPAGNLYIAYSFVTGPFGGNFSYIDDPVAREAKDKMMATSIPDPAGADAIHKELMKYELPRVVSIPGVCPPGYHMWWPWVKNYHGESSLGYTNYPNFIKYIWIDSAMKKSMTGR
jgi:peptide/nickel transport system substrate-binding protein